MLQQAGGDACACYDVHPGDEGNRSSIQSRNCLDGLAATFHPAKPSALALSLSLRPPPLPCAAPFYGSAHSLPVRRARSWLLLQGFEVGSGFSGTRLRGSVHNDPFVQKGDRLGTKTNNSGGIQGGISNGESIIMRIAFKPPATIGREQSTADITGTDTTLAAKGRHDPAVTPRAVPIVEAMAALVLADAACIQMARDAAAPREGVNPAAAALKESLATETAKTSRLQAELKEARSAQVDFTWQIAAAVVTGAVVAAILRR